MYFKLAIGNVRRSVRDYSVYFATLVLAACLLYSFIASGDYLQALDLTTEQRSVYARIGDVLSPAFGAVAAFVFDAPWRFHASFSIGAALWTAGCFVAITALGCVAFRRAGATAGGRVLERAAAVHRPPGRGARIEHVGRAFVRVRAYRGGGVHDLRGLPVQCGHAGAGRARRRPFARAHRLRGDLLRCGVFS
ncbi:hypothetical protein [Enorma phocaeensis]|uniref:hypothetical protein n=1 Tax=Enorma phocaeensis TaxID=1871019 RepID=UPI003209BACE